uniref:Plastid lipid-associated protein/fibrillin conserved domain-containing protein n=1 Tax=Odontella aurita TaxID=265563 RepID=A0A6U6C7N1_9STRA|mmetsp:Transcript_12088/g.35289  ORF Transcript_12088/g.35289 Transcript_12088/m.35289 type:complete len:365 (+) Transcript_12088:198-1292(+)
MKLSAFSLAAFLAAPGVCGAFAPASTTTVSVAFRPRTMSTPTAAFATADPSADDDDNDGEDGGPNPPGRYPSRSGIEGNLREPSASEIAIMDEMITKLAGAPAYELPQAVSKAIRVVSSPRFFMRIAERADQTSDEIMKAKLGALAENVVATLEAVVSTTEDRLDERAKEVEDVVKAAAEPDSGEFLVPLSAERTEAMRAALAKLDSGSLDEGFLSTVDAWMNKSHEDGMDGMVGILQKVLQIYAGTEIKRARAALQANVGAAVSGQSQGKADEVLAETEMEGIKPAAAFLEDLMNMDTDMWDSALAKSFSDEDGVGPKALMGEVQRTIEGVVLGLENGSMAQRVQAEFLRELVSRVEALEQKM